MAEQTQQQLRRDIKVYSWTGAFLFAGILLVLNFIVGLFPLRVDLSEGRVYSLSTGTKKLLGSLDDNLIVRLVFSPNLPPPYNLNEKYIRDILSECKRASKGHLRVEFIDPSRSEKEKERAQRDGIYPVEMNVTSKDKFEVQACFMGLALFYQDKKEAIPFIKDTGGFEYELAQRIKRLISAEKPSIGFVTTGGGLTPQSPEFEPLRERIDYLYTVKNIDLSTSTPIPSDLKALWVIGPTQAIKPEEFAKLKDWLKFGGSIGFLADRKKVDLQNFVASPVENGVENFLKDFGIDFLDGFVYDLQADRIQVRAIRGYIQMINVVEYPYFPMVTDIDRTSPVIKDIASFSMPFVAPLIPLNPVSGLTYTTLAKSSKYSYLDAYPYDLSPFTKKSKLVGAKEGPFPLLMTVQGNFDTQNPSNTKVGRLIVAGNSRFVIPGFSGHPENMLLFLNLLDWSAQDELLLSIRSKGSPFRPLKRIPDGVRTTLKTLLMVMMPILALSVGIVIWRRQKTRRALLPLRYQEN